MFIIFGTTTKKIKEDQCYFVCPQCQTLRPYNLWLPIMAYSIFYPAFPANKKQTDMLCQDCGSMFIPRVLENNILMLMDRQFQQNRLWLRTIILITCILFFSLNARKFNFNLKINNLYW